jgi:hypothetical protein
MGPRAGLDAVAKRKIPNPCRESDPDRPARRLVTVPTELHRLRCYLMCYNLFSNKLLEALASVIHYLGYVSLNSTLLFKAMTL